MGPISGRFRLTWVLREELAIGPGPWADRHLLRLQQEGIRGVLSLCAWEELPPPAGLREQFHTRRVVLPDHRSGRWPRPEDLEQALAALADLAAQGPVFVHCVAARERSPLVCLAWLMRHRGLSLQQGLDYLLQVHPGTSPLPQQLRALTGLLEA
ncbi:dual specificity protein phosphatase [Synechococcus sp. CCY9201]|uniref:protein-tyrosine phosphatase family protein n=1 Tax=Synechococcus sp. CCY9201 TaxID=174697 RepID=UPI002B205870|nr:dual specificity protein phosphatase [Synechococcus sp. CCY9201]MEA5474638.1 dual specificity protein phosphatase [Synechococcus sp. CCY9201]